jgi:hypothetical protein
MKTCCRALIGLIVVLGVMVASPPLVGAVVFTFDQVGAIPKVSDGANNAAVQAYMNSVLTANGGGSVTVTGAMGEANYTGDGHAVSRTNGTVRSETLGTTDGARWQSNVLVNSLGNPVTSHYSGNGGLDSFIVNAGSNNPDRITLSFNFAIESISFDYEIFPNGSCPNYSTCTAANWPDFTFEAGAAPPELVQMGIAPTLSGDIPNRSPASGSSNELAPQYIGFATINLNPATNGAANSLLQFIDWPARIGIDNLVVTRCCTTTQQLPVPEPSSLLLMSAGLVGLGVGAWRRHRSAS